MATSEIIEMVPCNSVYELSPKFIKIHHEILRREFKFSTKNIKKPVFIMYESPAFDPESILVLYKERKSYKLELLQFDNSLWNQMHDQIDKIKTNKYRSKQIKVSYSLSRKSKAINSETATTIKKAVDLVFKKARKPTEEETNSSKKYLDGTVFIFESNAGACGMVLEGYEGRPKILLDIALLLKQYIKSDEFSQADIDKQIINLASAVKNIL